MTPAGFISSFLAEPKFKTTFYYCVGIIQLQTLGFHHYMLLRNRKEW